MSNAKPRWSKDCEAKFNVVKNGKIIASGRISDAHWNCLEFVWEYDIDYWDPERDNMCTMIGVPEDGLEYINH